MPVMTLQDVADYCRVSIHTVRDWRRKGTLPVYKLPTGSIRVKREDVDALFTDATAPVISDAGLSSGPPSAGGES